MKHNKILVLILSCLILLSGCSSASLDDVSSKVSSEVTEEITESDSTNEDVTEESSQSDADSTDVETHISFELNENMQEVTFVRKVDGDTACFFLNGEEIKVRFLAIDTPETVKSGTEVEDWGPEASSYTSERLANADKIYLEWDDNSDKQDKYGRYLAWVWVDGSLLEEELVAQGYAEVAYLYGDYKYADELYDVQDTAKENGVGIWSE